MESDLKAVISPVESDEDDDFDDKEDENVLFSVLMGGYPQTVYSAAITKEDERMRLQIRTSNGHLCFEDCYITNDEFRKICNFVRKLNWEKEYCDDPFIKDGDWWSIKMGDFSASGISTYPEDYFRMMKKLWTILLHIVEKNPSNVPADSPWSRESLREALRDYF